MMKIKDYIFYRMYLAYQKHEGEGRFATVLYFVLIEYFLLFPFTLIALNILKPESKATGITAAIIPMVIIALLNFKRYYKKGKIEELKSRFGKSEYNHKIKNWMLYILPFLAGAWGLFGIAPIIKVLQLIKSLIAG